MSGKTSVSRRLAATLGYGCLSTDDLGDALRAATTRDSHPYLHLTDGDDYREYFVKNSAEKLAEDSDLAHRALWPAIEAVIRKHSTWGEPIVIEGWSLLPKRIIQLSLPGVRSLWLIANKQMLRERMVRDVEFYSGASDEESMIDNYLERSFYYNKRLKEFVKKFGLPYIEVPLQASVGAIVDNCLEELKKDPPHRH